MNQRFGKSWDCEKYKSLNILGMENITFLQKFLTCSSGDTFLGVIVL